MPMSTYWDRFGMQSVAAAVIVGLLAIGWNTTTNFISEHEIFAEADEQQREEIEKHEKILEQVGRSVEQNSKAAQVLANIYLDMMTEQGSAQVGHFGRDEIYVKVNVRSPAAQYIKRKELRITNYSSDELHSIKCKIKGTFSNNDRTYLLRLSLKAADALEAQGMIEVLLEPIEEEKK